MICPDRFRGKVMVVTGGAQGIGHGVAERACAEGASVLIADRAEFVGDIARALDAAGPGRVRALQCDLETHAGAEAAMQAAAEAFGGIDILVGGVGGAIRMRPYAAFEPAQIEAEVRRSLMPALWACHAVIPHLRARGGGVIVNISSNATRGIHRVPYSAAKGGVNALTASLAMELAPENIRVVAAAPGGTEAPPRRVPRNAEGDTPAERGWMEEAVRQVKGSSLMGRYGSIAEQVAPILFLASEEASYITASTLVVAGGDTG
ncbi:1,6-dihydroxycyclohexa-2,4-diene-1-carboxylate dehydrogenase [Pseudooceanicola sp. CBS1P-1]|uniref:1,6-dihydroxycyclohexa-2,4-diene-1-carboxylate dehydrogenase n=1 Tax=Pseudooceanicola albus TaxID=2692189 RepID=A0A6L7G7Z8_9RHOB|nr:MULTISPECIES: benzoate diol dehydrogenase BenD [Pseudooceanicola]MBT9385328.1 1,6-dihydroxycyclohexa-2,4-diene-1-carboxylate dehydrogenase [Pseudooceanicola endophyticus]MXN18813.1 1,6-dihydroxycyclohexa-2,4-diene-1-carboxylate dehydrogenase [Pseudooceanicola albus]